MRLERPVLTCLSGASFSKLPRSGGSVGGKNPKQTAQRLEIPLME